MFYCFLQKLMFYCYCELFIKLEQDRCICTGRVTLRHLYKKNIYIGNIVKYLKILNENY